MIDGRGAWADDGKAARLVASLRELLGADQAISVQVRAARWSSVASGCSNAAGRRAGVSNVHCPFWQRALPR